MDYSYRTRLHSLFGEEWAAIKAKPVAEIVPIDPYAPSLSRGENRLQVWDAAVGIPACRWRTVLRRGDKPVPVRNCNSGFGKHTAPAFAKAGPVKAGWRRPKAPYILDFVAHQRGWDLFEMCHVLAHHESLRDPAEMRIANRVRSWMAKTMVALRYDLPVFDGHWQSQADGDMFPPYGILAVAGSDSMQPSVFIPLSGVGAMVPDATVAVVGVGINLEPIPRGFGDCSMRWTSATRWCGSPTQATIGGWELVDVATHMPIQRERSAYFLHYLDMQDAATFGDFIAAARTRHGNLHGYKVLEFLDSELYRKLKAAAPPLPAADCLLFKSDETAGLVRPLGKRPEGDLNPRLREHAQWLEWDAALESIRQMVESATIFYERGLMLKGAGPSVLPTRKRRLATWRKLKAAMTKVRRLRDQSRSKRREGWLTEATVLQKEADELELWIKNQTEIQGQETKDSDQGETPIKTEEKLS